MEGGHAGSSGHTHQDDSWTCQRCGWVYPNAHPSAKHRRNHKKQCGKIKGLELRSEHKAGSSDDASSDDESRVKKENSRPPETLHDDIKPIEAGRGVPGVEHPSALHSGGLPVTEVKVSDKVNPDTPVLRGISASFDIKPEVAAHESTVNVIKRDVAKSESAAPEHMPDTVSFYKTAKPLGEGNLMHATLVDRVEVPALALPGLATDEAKESVEQAAKFEDAPIELTRERDVEAAEGLGKLDNVPKVEGLEAVACDSSGLDFDLENSAQTKDVRTEGSSHEHTQSIASLDERSRNLQEQSKVSFTPCVDQVEVGSAPEHAPEHTQSTASFDEPSKIAQEQSKVSPTPCVDKVEIADQVSRGLDSEHVRERQKKESSPILKEHMVNRQGSSQEDDSWTCNRCGWVYPNSHPSAKHRRNHKKQCGKIKGFELRTKPHKGGSSDEVSSDEDIHTKKEHLPHQSPQILEGQDLANNRAATGSTPPDLDTVKLLAEPLPHQSSQILEAQDQANNPARAGSGPPDVEHPAAFGEGRISTENRSSNLKSRDPSASKGAPEKELSAMPNLKDIYTPDIKSLDVVPELPQSMASLAVQNPPEGENKKGAAVVDQITVVLCELDGLGASQTKEIPKGSSFEGEALSNPAIVQEILESPETLLNAVPSLPKSVDASASEGLDDHVKDTLVEGGSTNQLAETPDGLLGDCAPSIASIPSVPDSLPSASSPAIVENQSASILKVDEPSLAVISAMDSRVPGLSKETLDDSAGTELSQSAILKEGKDVSENPVLVELDTSSNFKSSDALDDTVVNNPLRRETVYTTGGLEGRGGLLALDTISSDLSPPTLTADKVHVENKSVKENLLPPKVSSTADVIDVANDAEEGKFLSMQASENPVELITKNELLSEIVERGNDDVFSTSIDKAGEPTHSLEKQGIPIVVVEVDIPNEVITPADTTPEAKPIQERLGTPGYVASKKILLESEDLGQGAAPVSVGRKTEVTDTKSGIAKDSYMSDIVKESEAGGTFSVKDGHQVETAEASGAPDVVEKCDAKDDIPSEANGAPEAVEKPEAEEDTPFEARGIGSSDLSYTETNSVTRSETGLSRRSGLEAPAHRLDPPGYVASKKIPLESEDLVQGAALMSAGRKTEITNTESSLAKDSYMSDIVKESKAGGISSVKDGHQVETAEASGALEAVEKCDAKEDTPCKASGALEAVEKRVAKDDTQCEANCAPEAVEKPEAKEDTPCEASGIGLSDLSNTETDSITRSEAFLSGRSGLGASVHRLSDSLEIYEDAQDSLETCSVGGSVEENESLDEPCQVSDVIQEEPKDLGVASLDKGVPGESIGLGKGSSAGEASSEEKVSSDKRDPGLDKEPSILNGSSAGGASSEGKVATLPVRSEVEDLKAPSPEVLSGVSYTVRSEVEDLNAPSPEVLPGVSYTVRSEVEDLKAPSPEAWQEPGPSNFNSEGKKISTSEVTEDGKSGESHTALRSLMAKEGPEKADEFVETITPAGGAKSLNKAGGSLASGNGTKPKSRSFWSHCICCPTVH